MLHQLKSLWPRTSGNEWDLPKFHEQLHVPEDIHRFGAPRGTHTGPTEHNHIALVKRPATTAQRQRAVLDHQIAQRVTESQIINMAYNQMVNANTKSTSKAQENISIPQQSSLGRCEVNHVDGTIDILWVTSQNSMTEEFLSFLRTNIIHDLDASSEHNIQVFSECTINGRLYRAHKRYRQYCAWYDWVMIRYDRNDDEQVVQHPHWMLAGEHLEDTSNVKYSPGKILGFYSIDQGEVFCATQTTEYEYRLQSNMSCVWTLSEVMAIPIAALVNHCLMVPYDDSGDKWVHVWDREAWADKFFKI